MPVRIIINVIVKVIELKRKSSQIKVRTNLRYYDVTENLGN